MKIAGKNSAAVFSTDSRIKAFSSGTRACVKQTFSLFHSEHLSAKLRGFVLNEEIFFKRNKLFIRNVFRHFHSARRKRRRLAFYAGFRKHLYKLIARASESVHRYRHMRVRKRKLKTFFGFFRAKLTDPLFAYPFGNRIFHRKILRFIVFSVRKIVSVFFSCRATKNCVCKRLAVLLCRKTRQKRYRFVHSRRIRNLIHKIKLIKPYIKRGFNVSVYIFGRSFGKERYHPVKGYLSFYHAVKQRCIKRLFHSRKPVFFY